MPLSKSIPWIDASRLIAILGVICIHVLGPVFTDSQSDFFDKYIVVNAFDSLARASVPLFIMLSGALLLGKETSLKKTTIRIVRVLIPLVVWSLIYSFLNSYWTKTPFNFVASLVSLTHAPAMYHLWFVYMIIGLYLILPFLRPLTDAIIYNRALALYFFSLWFIINSITVYFPLNIIPLLQLSGFLSVSGYFILGYYLVHSKWVPTIPKKISGLVFLLASASTFGVSWYLNIDSPIPTEVAYEYLSPNVIITSCAALLCLKEIKIPPACEKIAILSVQPDIFSLLYASICDFNFDKRNSWTIF